MSKSPEQIHELFQDTLLVDEEIYWLGGPLHNYWHLKRRHVFYIFLICLLIPLLLIGLLGIGLGLTFIPWLISTMTAEAFFFVFYIIILLVSLYRQKHTPVPKDSHLEVSLDTHKAFYWWKPSYYAITNHRVLIFEQGAIRDYWHFLLDTPLLKKPKHRAASINLYSSTYAAEKKQTPVLDTLRGLPEDEADQAFAILRQAREEALEERLHKHGMDE